MKDLTKNDYVRLTNNEPLVLEVSALSDFLWADFVRDSAPRVQYLKTHYDIKKLSRFGKELFEALYQADNVKPLISLQDVEDYFRAIQDGEDAPMPEGYKPENAFWVGLMQDIVNSPAWSQIIPLCVGNQWNAGNNAVCILNRMSEVISNQIESAHVDPKALSDAGEELKNLRKQYIEQKKAGDKEGAQETREKGKQLGKKIEEYQNQVREEMRPKTQSAVNEATKEAKKINKAMSDLAGKDSGTPENKGLTEKRELANRLRNNKQLMRLANRLGALRKAWAQRKRARRANASYSDIVGVKFSDSVSQALPTELALAATEEGKALFALKYAQKTILSKDFEAPTKNLDRGPILMYVDISGSMMGESELWSKAMAYVVAEEALKQNRTTHICLFDTWVKKTFVLDHATPNKEQLLEFCLTWQTNGGTSFSNVLTHAMDTLVEEAAADILMITGGHDNIEDDLLSDFNQFKESKGVELHAFCIGEMSQNLLLFSDQVKEVNIRNDAESSDLFQDVVI